MYRLNIACFNFYVYKCSKILHEGGRNRNLDIQTKIVKVNPFDPDNELIREAANVIRRGGLVVFPTETVYGLGASIYIERAVHRIFEVKKRPLDNPLIVHIDNVDELEKLAEDIPDKAYKLVKKYWPGPLTIVLRRAKNVPSIVSSGLPTIAVRSPAHPVAMKLIKYSESPIAAPSANLAGKPSPTKPEHVVEDLYGKVELIIDAGETLYGVESTVIDLTGRKPVLLRPGAIPVEDIEAVLSEEIEIPEYARGVSEGRIALSPGIRYRHYAPDKELIVVESADYSELNNYALKVLAVAMELKKKKLKVGIIATRETKKVYEEKGFITLVVGSRSNLYEIAHNLFSVLREIDKADIDLAVSEAFEEKGLGLTIMNRLRKASRFNIIKV